MCTCTNGTQSPRTTCSQTLVLTFAFASPFDLEEMGAVASCALVALIYAGDVLASEDWASYNVEAPMGFEVADQEVASFPKMKLLLLPSRQTVEHIAKRPEKYAGHSYVACLLLLSFLYM